MTMSTEPRLIANLTRGTVVCERVVVADHPWHVIRGLIGQRTLPAGEGVLLQPAPSIHTAFMRFPIDAVFMDGTLRVLRIVNELPPRRAAYSRRAGAVLELSAGEIARRGIAVGDLLSVVKVGEQLETVQSGDRGSREIRVLMVGTDRRFRGVSATLLARRGCIVGVGERVDRAVDMARRQRADVVVLDAGGEPAMAARAAARIEALHPPVGVVIVLEDPDGSSPPVSSVAKWDSFDALYDAIERALPGSNGPERAWATAPAR
jgi:uncharacterized membrane protein (UPF0127 family)